MKVDILGNDYPEYPDEPDYRMKGKANELHGGSIAFELLLSHEGEKFDLPKGRRTLLVR